MAATLDASTSVRGSVGECIFRISQPMRMPTARSPDNVKAPGMATEPNQSRNVWQACGRRLVSVNDLSIHEPVAAHPRSHRRAFRGAS